MKLTDIQEQNEEQVELKVLKAPERDNIRGNTTKVFLAGSIDMGKAVDWQTQVTEAIKAANIPNVVIFNPRRDDWDSSWEQSINDPKFNEQVTWEMDHLDDADIIAVFFDPKGQAPITLLELGLHARDQNLIVCCPDGFWRKGNVEMVCDRYGLPLFDNIEEFIKSVIDAIKTRWDHE